MIMKSRRIIQFSLLLVLPFFVFTQTSTGLSANQDLLIDDFNTDTLDTSIWFWGPNSQEASYYFEQGILYITGGITDGGGGIINSKSYYIMGTDVLVFETRVKLFSDYYAHWGFWANNHDGHVLFQQYPEGLVVAFRKDNQSPAVNISIPGVDLSIWHDYTIKLYNSRAEIYVDGVLKAVHTSDLPIGKPLLVYLSQSSGGISYTQAIDYVYIRREPDIIQVNIDIKPGGGQNSINPNSKGVIPVAILSTPQFDAASLNLSSLFFGPSSAPIEHKNGHLQDIDGDGSLDLLVHFRTQDTGIACGDTSASLNGETISGQAFTGIDSITTTGCN
jgi:hypothetical protein